MAESYPPNKSRFFLLVPFKFGIISMDSLILWDWLVELVGGSALEDGIIIEADLISTLS